MSEISNLQGKNVYEEDISVGPTGTELIGGPCTVWDVTVCVETDVTAVVSFSPTAGGYSASDRSGKVVIDGPGTQHLVFAKGRYCEEGLSCVSNVGSVDVRVSYD